MADTDVTAKSAEKAYAEAAAEVKPAAANAPASKPAPVETPAPVAKKPAAAPKKAAPKKKPAASSRKTRKPATKPAAKPSYAKAAKRAARVARAAAAPAPAKITQPIPSVTELKEKIMATAKTTDFTQPMAEAFGEIQSRTKAAYEKSTEVVTEMTDFAKGNVEAIVESGKIFAGGAQKLGKTYVDEAKSAYETATSDLKEMAAVKSPAELFQLQGKIMRRNFDTLVSTSSKNAEAFMKLANDSFAPLSGRVNVAAEKLTKVA